MTTAATARDRALQLMREGGMSEQDIAGLGYGGQLVGKAVDEQLIRLERDNPGTFNTWRTYLRLLADGAQDLCPCPCDRCSTGLCPCSPSSATTQSKDGATAGEGGHGDGCTPPGDKQVNCASRYAGHRDNPVTAITTAHIEDLGWWAQRRALKRTVAFNVKRRAQGREEHRTDGRSARMSAVQASRWLFEQLIDQEAELSRNPAAKAKMPAKQEKGSRALHVAEFLEAYNVAITTGQDPELDGLLMRHLLIQATRRGGLLDLRCHGLDVARTQITYWDEKKDTFRTRPSTREHLAQLIAHVLERGPRVPAAADAPETLRRTGVPVINDNDPVFYNRPKDTFDGDGYFVSRATHPVSRKRIESLFKRIRRHLEWADRRGLRAHDVRHTSAQIIYRAADAEMARLQLAQDAGSTTEHYLTVRMDELGRLKQALFSPSPAAPPSDTAAAGP